MISGGVLATEQGGATGRPKSADRATSSEVARGMWSRATGIAVAAALLFASPAAAQQPTGPFAPWDGTNPFNCTIQDVDTGVDFADPFCVEFDKTQQNVTDLGILDFLANEPIRVAAAVDKCFYFQTDHWTGSVVQGEEPELWHWDGQYFFDKAIGAGGVNVTNFRVLGQPASFPPGTVPAEFEPYFDQGGGGAYVVTGIPADPAWPRESTRPRSGRRCARAARRRRCRRPRRPVRGPAR